MTHTKVQNSGVGLTFEKSPFFFRETQNLRGTVDSLEMIVIYDLKFKLLS